MRIHFGMIGKRVSDSFYHNVVERNLELFADLLESGAHFRRAHHVEFRREIECRNRTE